MSEYIILQVFLFPVGEVLGLFQKELAIGIDEELGGGAFATEDAVALAEDLILEVETRSGLTDIGGMDDGHVVHAQGGQMAHMDIINGGGYVGGQHDFVAYTGIVTPEGLASVLEVLDIVAMPYTQHGVHLAELNTNLAYICQFLFHSVFG